jgi:predicted nuclease of restriction endonuclease-like RecB superfamily
VKFLNKKTGKYRSLLEKQIDKTMPRRKGVKVSYETHTISYVIPRTYHPDFTLVLPSGKVIFIEVKGYFRQEDKVKMKAVRDCNPTLDIRMVFPRTNKKDIRWCEKYGFPWAVGRVPSSWLQE